MTPPRKFRTTLFGLAIAVAFAVLAIGTSLYPRVAQAQRRYMRFAPNAKYDGRFTFVRLSYQVFGRSGWEFDYPEMEHNFMTIINDLSTLHPHMLESNIHAMDDPMLSHYPVSYLSEPGWWHPDQKEAEGLRNWIAKGGFLIVDDFYFDQQWNNFNNSMHIVMPNAQIMKLDVSHPIFNSFFKLKTLDGLHHPDNANAHSQFLGIFEDNDPTKRLQVIINYNNDIGDYMEWSGEGYYAVNLSNDAYKLATNYVIYAMTH